MGHTSGALRSRNFASSARGLRPDGKSASMSGWRGGWVKSNRTSQAVLGGTRHRGELQPNLLETRELKR
jgi:hypothetical protein